MTMVLAEQQPSWDQRVDTAAYAAGRRAWRATDAALKRGVAPERVLDLLNVAIEDFTSTHPEEACGRISALRSIGERQRFEDLYRALRAGAIPRYALQPLECLVLHAQTSGDDIPCGYRPALYLNMVEWLVGQERSTDSLLKLVFRAAENLVRWGASELHFAPAYATPPSSRFKTAADAFISALAKAGAA